MIKNSYRKSRGSFVLVSNIKILVLILLGGHLIRGKAPSFLYPSKVVWWFLCICAKFSLYQGLNFYALECIIMK